LDSFVKNFMRRSEGVWECRHAAELRLPAGLIIKVAPGTVFTKGTEFMGVDIVEMLEAESRRTRLQPRL
jgi:hypothetical protein